MEKIAFILYGFAHEEVIGQCINIPNVCLQYIKFLAKCTIGCTPN